MQQQHCIQAVVQYAKVLGRAFVYCTCSRCQWDQLNSSQDRDSNPHPQRLSGRHGGGGKKRGVENLTNDTPPKKGFWTPLRTVRFPPPSRVSALFFLYRNP